MAATERPLSLPEWASDIITEHVDEFEYPNKSEPSQGLKDSGLLYKQGLARANYNYQQDLINQWLAFLDATVTPLGSVIFIDPAINVDFENNIPFGWIADGTQVIGATTYDVYKRTQ